MEQKIWADKKRRVEALRFRYFARFLRRARKRLKRTLTTCKGQNRWDRWDRCWEEMRDCLPSLDKSDAKVVKK